MRKPVTVAMSVLTAGVAALGLRSSMHSQAAAGGLAPAGVDGSGASPSSTAGHRPTTASRRHRAPASAHRTTSPAGGGRVRVTGQGEQTPYGPLQVQITLQHGRIVEARTLVHPEGGHSSEVNAAAVPVLDDETVRSQGGQVDAVSGATYTSEAYQQSLQFALDAAHRDHLL